MDYEEDLQREKDYEEDLRQEVAEGLSPFYIMDMILLIQYEVLRPIHLWVHIHFLEVLQIDFADVDLIQTHSHEQEVLEPELSLDLKALLDLYDDSSLTYSSD
jgi:hypothetical protein